MIKHLMGYCTLTKDEIKEWAKNQTAEQKKLGAWLERLWDEKVSNTSC